MGHRVGCPHINHHRTTDHLPTRSGPAQTCARPPCRWWGIPPTRLNLSSGRHPLLAMRSKFLAYKVHIWAMLLNIAIKGALVTISGMLILHHEPLLEWSRDGCLYTWL